MHRWHNGRFASVERSDRGDYQCVATNNVGPPVNMTVPLTVRYQHLIIMMIMMMMMMIMMMMIGTGLASPCPGPGCSRRWATMWWCSAPWTGDDTDDNIMMMMMVMMTITMMQLPDLGHRLVAGWRGAGQLRAGDGGALQHGAHLHPHHTQGGTLAVCRLTKVIT